MEQDRAMCARFKYRLHDTHSTVVYHSIVCDAAKQYFINPPLLYSHDTV